MQRKIRINRIWIGVLFILLVAAFLWFLDQRPAPKVSVQEAAVIESNQNKSLTLEERNQEIKKIEQDVSKLEKEKQQYTDSIEDGENAKAAVHTDFSNGRLSKQDKDMLLNLFQEKVDKSERSAEEIQQQLSKLDARKQELVNGKEQHFSMKQNNE